MKLFAPAKVNLALNVGPRGTNGYHRVDSVFHTIEHGDIVTVEPAESTSLTCTVDLGLADPEDNLALRAVRAFDERFATESRVRIHIEKHIAHGGGLGGGSSDAAAVLFALARLHGRNPRTPALREVAATLGSDVPVFLTPTGACVMRDHGQRFDAALPPAVGVPLVVALPPDAHAATGEVYRTFDLDPQPTKPLDVLIAVLEDAPVHEAADRAFAPDVQALADKARLLCGEVYNNLSTAAITVEPCAGDALLFLLQRPESLCATISGSGVSSFALCLSDADARSLADACRREGFTAFSTTLRARGVTPMNEVSYLNA